jgi:hypothetical protein
MSSGISSIGAVPNEILDRTMRCLPAVELIRIGLVCRLWRELSEIICEQRCQQEYGRESLITPSRPLMSWRDRFSFNYAFCRARGKAWEQKETHPDTLWAVKGFVRPGHHDIVCHALEAPVHFEEIAVQTYVVRCGVKARFVQFSLSSSRSSCQASIPELVEFPSTLGAIWQVVRFNGWFFVLAGEEGNKKIYAFKLDVVKFIIDVPDGTSMIFDSKCLMVGTKEGKLIGWNIGEGLTAFHTFVCQIGEGPLSYLSVYTGGRKMAVIATEKETLLITRDLYSIPRVNKIPMRIEEGHHPFLHHSYLVWKSKELGYVTVNLDKNDWQDSYLDWIYASPVAGGKLLVQDDKKQVFIFDEQLRSTMIGAFPFRLQAADLRDDLLLAISTHSDIYLYKVEEKLNKVEKELRPVYEYHGKVVAGERVVMAHLNAAHTIVYGTNNGRLIYGSPIFEWA